MSQYMNPGFVKRLGEQFGADKVRVCSPYHVQVQGARGCHNIWSGAEGWKIQMAGSRGIKNCSPSMIISLLKSYDPAKSDLGKMEEALALTSLIKRAVRENKTGIFVDAGWKNGKAKIAVIMIEGSHIAAESFVEDHPNSTAAEVSAIRFALNYNPFRIDPAPFIFSDCSGAIDIVGDPRVVWISREGNVSDTIGNMRK